MVLSSIATTQTWVCMIVRRALVQPLRWIAENAGDDGYVVAAKVAEQPVGHGYNAKTGEYVDLFEAGVIDPVKVTRSALQNASSIAAWCSRPRLWWSLSPKRKTKKTK